MLSGTHGCGAQITRVVIGNPDLGRPFLKAKAADTVRRNLGVVKHLIGAAHGRIVIFQPSRRLKKQPD